MMSYLRINVNLAGKLRLFILITAAIACFVLLFVGGPSYTSSRSLHSLWNLGHIVTFALWTYLVLVFFPKIRRLSCNQFFISLLAGAILLGSFTEIGQHWVDGRTPSLADLIRDIVGCLLVIAFAPNSIEIPSRARKIQLRSIVLILLFWQIWPVARDVIDEITATLQFPVIANFETPLEMDRWSLRNPNTATITDTDAYMSKHSLKVVLTPMRYSGLSLQYFPGDWRGYRQLGFDIKNDSLMDLALTCRIHDKDHRGNGQKYSDRFNQRIDLKPGWQHVTIKTDKIQAAPKGRTMDMDNIIGLGLFATNLTQNRVIYIDNVQLYE